MFLSAISKTKHVCTKCVHLQSTIRKISHRSQLYTYKRLEVTKKSLIRKTRLLYLDGSKYGSPGNFHTSALLSQNDDSSNEDENVIDDPEYKEFVQEYHKHPHNGHSLFVIHPAVRYDPRNPKLTTPELEMEEACTLVRTLDKWSVAEQKIVKVSSSSLKTANMFGPNVFKEMGSRITNRKNISAVFLNVSRLNKAQIMNFQAHWQLPVFDRYSIVIQIFKQHALSNVAKLQVALAEIPVIRDRLEELNAANPHQVQSGLAKSAHGRGAKTPLQIRKALLQDTERKLKKALTKVKHQRELLRTSRKRKELPTVAVVGYTNSGKTTLIKALTGDERMLPENQLFATLDVTAHGGLLPNKMTVLYMDTVGFISNLHHNLIDAFSATLEDALAADIVLHVRDVSHPDAVNQKVGVMKILTEKLTKDQMDNIIEVCNKVDKLSQNYFCEGNEMPISAVTGQGLDVLVGKIQHKLLGENSIYLEKRLKIPDSGDQLSWLYQESKVQDIQTDTENHLIVDVVISKTAYEKFKSKFYNVKQKTDFPKIKRS
ncbi:putative GTP-binding protein 6 [Mytilus californianus]|uniref:putative GTP-binding protein 6 n=1 Tax=Mytilus californianus TaxID=6549 RepID=UPI002245643C|nr:putative GTP-binding protein 6 [Mytilus californianus]XP_052064542.1 putative GTP-binding protein 6 [Mytilus californianus]